MKTIPGFGLGIALMAQCAAGAAAPASPPVEDPPRVALTPAYINSLSESLRTNNPALRAAAARSDAANAGIGAVRTWEDPMVMIGGMIAEEEMRMEDGDLIYGVEQRLPLFGRPGAFRRAAKAARDVSEAEADFQFQWMRRDLALALFRAGLADRLVEIGEQDLEWLSATLATTESRYQVGEVIQAQLLRLQNERSRRLEQLKTDRRRRDLSRVLLNRILGMTNAPAWPRFDLPPPAGTIVFSEKLVGLSTRYEPRLKVLRRMAAEAEAMVHVARRARHPEVSLGAEARNYTRDGDFRQAMVSVSMSLPWFNAGRYRSEIRREEARRAAAELDIVDYELGIREEVHRLVVEADAARREAELYRNEIIPRSEQMLASAEAAWISSRGMFLEVMEARRMLLESRLMFARAVTTQYEILTELVLCCGLADLEALQMLGAAPAAETPAETAP